MNGITDLLLIKNCIELRMIIKQQFLHDFRLTFTMIMLRSM